jgi:hypothetical protein
MSRFISVLTSDNKPVLVNTLLIKKIVANTKNSQQCAIHFYNLGGGTQGQTLIANNSFEELTNLLLEDTPTW